MSTDGRNRRETEKFPTVEFPSLSSRPDMPAPPSRPSFGPGRPSFVDPEWLKEEDTSVSRTTEAELQVAPPSREKNRALLTVQTGINAGQVFSLDQRETVIGRGRDVQLRLEDAGISRQHTRIVRSLDDHYFLEDMKSTNGTFVGGRRIDRCEIEAGDVIQVGPNVSLGFSLIDEKGEQLAKRLYESSTRDALTQAYNRRYFAERLASEVAYANRHKTRLAVVIFDLDHFKKVNDDHGHLAGDDVLKAVAQGVAKMIRVEDVFARYGGEEFVVIVRGIEHKNVALFGERIRKHIERLEVHWESARIKPTVSVGVASLEECGDMGTCESLLLLADERLYQAKHEGRNRVVAA
jgi:diguanylate cyclase (GGDEF)-like protein